MRDGDKQPKFVFSCIPVYHRAKPIKRTMFENIAEAIGESVGGLTVGIAGAIAAPFLLPALRPVAKQLLKAGIVVGDKAQVWIAETTEQWQDLVAEARAEVEAGTVTVESAE
jgi:hypothetical protein